MDQLYPLKKFSVDVAQQGSPAARRLKARTGMAQVRSSEPPRHEHYREGKQWLHLTSKKGAAFDRCASLDERYLCCRVHVLRAVSNCPYECSYCFLQHYLTDNTTTVVADTASLIEEVKEKTAREPWRFFRIGTWELGDSLALEPLVGAAAELVLAFAKLPNAVLELKTKADGVDGLLNLPHAGRTVVSWTMNPEAVVKTEELRTASVERRLAAMKKVVEAGYLVGVHFDPIILHDGWEAGSQDLIQRIFKAAPPERVAWISIGSLRFNPEMKRAIEDHYPGSKITTPEMVLGDDGKMRYLKPVRLALYRHVYRHLRAQGGGEVLVYLCMERPEVWKRVFGHGPQSIGHLDYLFAESLHRRYPGLVHQKPDLARYEGSAPQDYSHRLQVSAWTEQKEE